MIAFASRTGNIRYICAQINLPNIEIKEGLSIKAPFILATYTDGLGAIPSVVEQFMKKNYSHCFGIIVSGNRNFGAMFGAAGDLLAKQYDIPLICKIDLRGQQRDYARIEQFINEKGYKDEAVFKAE